MFARLSAVRVAVALLAIACVAAVGVRATDAAPIPAPVPVTVRSAIAFDERFSEDWDTAAGSFRVDARIPLDPADVATFDGDTYFDVSAGYFDFDGYLSDDPNWKPGDTSATFTDVGYDGDTQLVMKLKWTPTQLVVRVTAVTGDDIDPIISDDYSMDDSGRIADETEAEIELGNTDIWWDTLPCAGRVATWTVRGDDHSVVRMHGRAAQ
jgi:hypothetical protein